MSGLHGPGNFLSNKQTTMSKKIFIILLVFVGCLTSCDYKWIETEEIQLPEGPVSFSEQIVPIFQNNCTDCHSSTSPVLTQGEAYNNLIQGGYINTDQPRQSTLYKKVDSGHPGGSSSLSSKQLALILRWIEQGAENN